MMIDQSCSKKQWMEEKVGEEEEQGPGSMQEVNVDILTEIFIRVPDCRSAILCSSVCHDWHHLFSQPQFVPRFTSHHHQHQDRYPPPYTIIFLKCEVAKYESTLNFQPICKLYSNEPMFLHGKSNLNYLDFLPSSMVVRASCDDLLLLTPGARCFNDLYIANPVTKQFYHLPQYPCMQRVTVQGYALVRMPDSKYHFKVFLIHHPSHPLSLSEGPICLHTVSIFCSKLGKWETKPISYPRPWMLLKNALVDVLMCNEILYWLEYDHGATRVISLDISRIQCKIIAFPQDFWWIESQCIRGNVREQVGIVGGEVRLIQVVLTKVRTFGLKVWKLLDNSSSWVLIHDKKYLKRPNEEGFISTFVHPTNGDMVFMVWGQNVFQFNLMMDDTYEMIDELQEHLKLNTGNIETTERLLCFPMVHPPWPTPLPSV